MCSVYAVPSEVRKRYWVPCIAFVDGCEPPCRSRDSNSAREAGALCGGSLSCPWKLYFSSVWSEVQLKSGEKRHWEQWTACTMLPSRSLEPGGKEQNTAQFSISPLSSEGDRLQRWEPREDLAVYHGRVYFQCLLKSSVWSWNQISPRLQGHGTELGPAHQLLKRGECEGQSS